MSFKSQSLCSRNGSQLGAVALSPPAQLYKQRPRMRTVASDSPKGGNLIVAFHPRDTNGMLLSAWDRDPCSEFKIESANPESQANALESSFRQALWGYTGREEYLQPDSKRTEDGISLSFFICDMETFNEELTRWRKQGLNPTCLSATKHNPDSLKSDMRRFGLESLESQGLMKYNIVDGSKSGTVGADGLLIGNGSRSTKDGAGSHAK